MSSLPYDIIYRIYFHISDYPTLSNFWILDKNFLEHYMRNNAPYTHKFFSLRAQLLEFILLLPLTDLYNSKQLDDNIKFYQDVMFSNCLSPVEKTCYANDLLFVYNMYKPLLCSTFALTLRTYPLVHVNKNIIGFYYFY